MKTYADKPYFFGDALRGLRLGYKWHDRMQCFVQAGDALDRDRFIVHLCTVTDLRKLRKPAVTPHRVWWEYEGDIFQETELRNVVRVKQSAILTLDEDGRIVKTADRRNHV